MSDQEILRAIYEAIHEGEQIYRYYMDRPYAKMQKQHQIKYEIAGKLKNGHYQDLQ